MTEVGGPPQTPSTEPATDEEIVAFWESARSRAGLGRIAVVGGVSVAAGVPPMAWAFGDDARLADELLGLVLEGTKTATSSLLSEYGDDTAPLPTVGDLSIILDGTGHPRALIRTTEVEVLPFTDVTVDFAAAEGEDDRSLEAWREGHTRYFSRQLGVDTLPDDLMVVAERFELLYPR